MSSLQGTRRCEEPPGRHRKDWFLLAQDCEMSDERRDGNLELSHEQLVHKGQSEPGSADLLTNFLPTVVTGC